jgi:hypothetical protein
VRAREEGRKGAGRERRTRRARRERDRQREKGREGEEEREREREREMVQECQSRKKSIVSKESKLYSTLGARACDS